jgi:hyperosmotically inducible protein
MRAHNSFLTIGAACLAFAASVANAQVGIGVEGAGRAAGGVTEAGRGAGAGRVGGAADAAAGVSGGVRGLSDAEIGVGVQTALSHELTMPGVRSDVQKGVATLHGTVASEAEKRRAEQIARRVEGVSRVRNDLVVSGTASTGAQSGSQVQARGTSLDAAVTSRIESDAQLAARDIVVKTRSDVVTLTGEVASTAEKEAAGRLAADAAAGAEVRNRLTVRGEK